MVLLDLLAQLAPPRRWRLTVAHFNHQLRGRSSDADQRLVQRGAAKLGLRFVAGHADVRKHAQRRKLSVEMAARELRHRFLARAARRLKLSTIAVAHHADDQIELFFLRLLRGSGGEGLAGMKWRNPSPSDPAVELVRPLLDLTKAALHAYAINRGVTWREDASNALTNVQRNRIRHDLLPWLERKFGAAFHATLPRLMEIVGAESEFVTEVAEQWLTTRAGASFRRHGPAASPTRPAHRPDFATLPAAVQRRCLHLQLLWHGVAPDFELVEQLRLAPDRPVSVGPNLCAQHNQNGRIELRRAQPQWPKPRPSAGTTKRVELRGRAGETDFGDVEFSWRILAAHGARRGTPAHGREVFDADKTGRRMILRHWRAGDRFQPLGLPAATKLQDLFTNRKIPRAQRHRLIVAQKEGGEIFWVEGLRIGEHFKLDKSTRHRLKWTWRRPKPGV